MFSAVTYELFWNSLPNFFMTIFYFQHKCPKFCDMQLFEVKLFYSWALYKNIYWIWKKKKKKSVSATDFCTFYLPKSLQSEKVWNLNLHVDMWILEKVHENCFTCYICIFFFSFSFHTYTIVISGFYVFVVFQFKSIHFVVNYCWVYIHLPHELWYI